MDAMVSMQVEELFAKYDKNADEEIDKEEARELFAELFATTFGTSVVEAFGNNAEATF